MSFQPYVNNGGTCVGIAGEDFAVVAGDTRMSRGYSILSRDVPKLLQLTDKVVLAASGMQADINALRKILTTRIEWFVHQHGKVPSIVALNRMVSNILFSHRFRVLYSFTLLVGVNDDGKGMVFNYDAIGSDESVSGSVSGTAGTLMRPFIDSQVDGKNQVNPDRTPKSSEATVALIKDAFASATERDIYTGDSVDIWVVRASGIEKERMQLRRD